jgi:hypothetical protein
MADDQAPATGRELLEALERAYAAAAAAVESAPDGRAAFGLATDLAFVASHMSESAAKLRAATAARIADEESLSLAALAGKLSMSKARAAQLVRSGRAASSPRRPPKPAAEPQPEGHDDG